MEQMQAIWAALDEMLEKDPKKYEEFIKTQMEVGRSSLVPEDAVPGGGVGGGSKLLSSMLSPLTQQNPGQISSKAGGAGGGGDSSSNTKVTGVKHPGKEKLESTNQKPDEASMEKEKEAHAFELKLPVGVAPTKVKVTKGVLIEEISSTENDDEESKDEDK